MKKILIIVLLNFALIANINVFANEIPLSIPSDPKANYSVIKQEGSASMPIITTKRLGRSGISYSKRIFNCKDKTTKYLGTGESLIEMDRSSPDPKFGPIVSGSIAYYQWIFACKR